jgi:L-ascorbate metabolism protein UlaG (beta-lactamase superfamily)
MELTSHSGGAKALLEVSLEDDAVGLAWLGQAGFVLRHAGRRVLIDPYLSDHLARKYAGTEFPHERMMPAPLEAAKVRDLDWVLCSHRHGDHMDPGSLAALAANNPRCRFVAPRAELESAAKIGLAGERLVPANDGDEIRLGGSMSVHIVPAAHETLQMNARGEHRFLGFIISMDGFTLYHSGDCVVYEGLVQRLRQWPIDLALLPVNGRQERLTAKGILGNMNFDEAKNLCLRAKIGFLIPHHFGMFAFNTVDAGALRQRVEDPNLGVRCILPSATQYFLWSRHQPA